MAKFVLLMNWTDTEVRGLGEVQKDTDPAAPTVRRQRIQDYVEEIGGALDQVYWTLGAYDVVAVVELDDENVLNLDEDGGDATSAAGPGKVPRSMMAAAGFSLALGNDAGVRTMTLPAFEDDAMKDVIKYLARCRQVGSSDGTR